MVMSWEGSNGSSCATWHAGSCRIADLGSSDKYMQTDRMEGCTVGWHVPHCAGQNVYNIVLRSLIQADSFGNPYCPRRELGFVAVLQTLAMGNVHDATKTKELCANMSCVL